MGGHLQVRSQHMEVYTTHMRTMVLVLDYLHDWVIFRGNLGKYAIHGAYGYWEKHEKHIDKWEWEYGRMSWGNIYNIITICNNQTSRRASVYG